MTCTHASCVYVDDGAEGCGGEYNEHPFWQFACAVNLYPGLIYPGLHGISLESTPLHNSHCNFVVKMSHWQSEVDHGWICCCRFLSLSRLYTYQCTLSIIAIMLSCMCAVSPSVRFVAVEQLLRYFTPVAGPTLVSVALLDNIIISVITLRLKVLYIA